MASMKIYNNPGREQWPELIQRPGIQYDDLEKKVRKILRQVKTKGDKAIKKLTAELDGCKLKKFEVTKEEIARSSAEVSESLKQAIGIAYTNIEKFHRAQQEEVKIIETMPGVTCWRRSVAIERVGLYIPGGSAPLFSTVLMLGIPASLAGCKEIILCTPPSKDGQIDPVISYTASICGITKIFKIGGAQAIAAMAYGTDTVPQVFKIMGPGNQFVTLAKQIVQEQSVAIDMPAGPSEVLVIADKTANASFVAGDLLSQAEHGPDSQVMLVTTDLQMAADVQEQLRTQIKQLPREAIVAKALSNSKLLVVKDLATAIEFSNLYAPEHLILACEQAKEIINTVTAAGSVFIGNYSPESAGDYASGTNHTLPTNGYAAMYSGVSLDSFVKKITYQHVTEEGLGQIGNAVMQMATAEGLTAHKNAIAIRLKK